MMISAEAHAALAETLAALLNRGYNYFGFEAPDDLHAALEHCQDDWGYYVPALIYQELYTMNQAAYCARYKDVEPGPVPAMPTVPTLHEYRQYNNYHATLQPWHYKLAKLIDCEVYQLNENPTCKSALYTGLVELSRVYRAFLVTNTDEYNAAPWGQI